jgi:uncharacterized protein YggE
MKNQVLTFVLTFLLFYGYGQESGKNFIDQNFIEVTGYAERQITPDRVYLKIMLNEKDFKGKTLNEVEKSMITALQELGIDVSKNLAIKDFISKFKSYWIFNSEILQIKEYELRVFEAKTVEEVFRKLEKIGISNLSIERLSHSEIEKYKQEIRIEAIKLAREKATTLVHAIGQEIGRALLIAEQGNHVNMNGAITGQASGIMIRGLSSKSIYGSRAPDPDIEFETIRLEYSITVKFELK